MDTLVSVVAIWKCHFPREVMVFEISYNNTVKKHRKFIT
jgi:hypothetical protein